MQEIIDAIVQTVVRLDVFERIMSLVESFALSSYHVWCACAMLSKLCCHNAKVT